MTIEEAEDYQESMILITSPSSEVIASDQADFYQRYTEYA